MKTKYVMAGCKSTQHGRFNTREDIEALLLALSDIVLDVGSDQKRSPRILPNGKVDTNDATVEQYQKYLAAEELKKKQKEDNVSEHLVSTKKRKSSADSIVVEDYDDDEDEEADTEDDSESVATFNTEDAEDILEMDDEGMLSDKVKKGCLRKGFRKHKKASSMKQAKKAASASNNKRQSRALKSSTVDYQAN